jgi:hypothetical protein
VSGEVPAAQPLVAFHGPVTVRSGCGAVTLLLRGRESADRRGREYAELAFADAQATALPARLRDARVLGPEPGFPSADGRRRYRIEATVAGAAAAPVRWSADVRARSVQLHREDARVFFGAVPPPRLSLARRLGWPVLLAVLRLPGAARIVERIRGTT